MKMIIEGNSQEEICLALLKYKRILKLMSLPKPGTEYWIPVLRKDNRMRGPVVSVKIEDSPFNEHLEGPFAFRETQDA